MCRALRICTQYVLKALLWLVPLTHSSDEETEFWRGTAICLVAGPGLEHVYMTPGQCLSTAPLCPLFIQSAGLTFDENFK